MSDPQDADTMTAMPCIVCDRQLVNAVHGARNQPSEGVNFHTHGHYGSGVFDPMISTEAIEVNVCDQCLLAKADKVLFRREVIKREEHYEYMTFAEFGERYG